MLSDFIGMSESEDGLLTQELLGAGIYLSSASRDFPKVWPTFQQEECGSRHHFAPCWHYHFL
jgi:hypothetical protein